MSTGRRRGRGGRGRSARRARARARRAVSAPLSTSTRSGVVPRLRELSIASSTWRREASPISTITSVRKRGEEPLRDGLVMPDNALASPCGARSVRLALTRRHGSSRRRARARSAARPSARASKRRRAPSSSSLLAALDRDDRLGHVASRRRCRRSRAGRRALLRDVAHREPPRSASVRWLLLRPGGATMTSRGASRPVHSSKLRAPCATRTSQAVDRPRAMRCGGGKERGGLCVIDEIDDMRVLADLIERQTQLVERTILSGRAFDPRRP